MEKVYIATVKNIELGTREQKGNVYDSFVSDMSKLIGKKIIVRKISGIKKWYEAIYILEPACFLDVHWSFHKDWLE